MEHQAAVETHAVERYLLGEMPVEERDAFEEHYFSCVACAEDVRAGAQLRANYDHRAATAVAEAPRRWWENWLRWPSLVPVAASLVFAGVVWFEAGRRPVLDAVDDYTVQETVRSGSASVVPKGAGPATLSFAIPADATKPPYECTISDANGKAVGRLRLNGRPGTDGHVLLQRDRLNAGLYTVTLNKDGALVAQYTFQLQ